MTILLIKIYLIQFIIQPVVSLGKLKYFIIILTLYLLVIPRYCLAGDLPLGSIKLPVGFKIELYAADLPGARSMALGPKGTLFVGTREQGLVYACVDKNNDKKIDDVVILARGLFMPNGVAFYNNDLYVAEVNRVIKFKDIEDNLYNDPGFEIINDSFPKDTHHGWKFIAFGPDGMLYVPVGAPCNICESGDERYATIMRMKLDGSGLEIFCRGVRNTVGFDWHPRTKELWFTDNGRDMMGEDVPADELNRAPRKGLHFGFPYFHGRGTPDPGFGKGRKNQDYVSAAAELGPHVAALGMRFYTAKMFPAEYDGRVFIAEHGSWNRIVPSGYRITVARLRENTVISYEVFADGWLQGSSAWGRPVDLLQMPDGSLLVSDDKAGVVYRISYQKN